MRKENETLSEQFSPSPDDPLRTVEEVAKAFAVKPYTVRVWLREGSIKGIKINGNWRIQQSEMTRYANAQFGDSNV